MSTLEQAYVEIVDLNSPDLDTNEPTTVQSHLKKNRFCRLTDDYKFQCEVGNRYVLEWRWTFYNIM